MIRVIAAFLGALGVYALVLWSAPRGTPAGFEGTVEAHQVPPITLTSDVGRARRIDAPLRGEVLVFGYTRCADQCPITLAAVSAALASMPVDARAEAFFVTVDPQHDTPNVLHTYLGAWNHSIVGLSARVDDLRRLQHALGAGDGKASGHDTRLFLVNPSGEAFEELSPDITAAELRKALNPRP